MDSTVIHDQKRVTSNPLTLGRNRWLILMLLPAVLFLLAMSLYPTVRLISMALTDMHLLRPGQEEFVGFKNFVRLVSDSSVLYTFRYTALFVGVGVAVEFFLGFGLALFLNDVRWAQQIIRTIVFSPMIVPPVVVGLTWRLMYDPELGIVNYLSDILFGINRVPWLGDPTLAPWALIIVDIWQWSPFLAMIYLAGLQSIPLDLYEAAQIDGANAWQMLRLVTVPLMKPILLIGVLFRAIDSVKTFELVYTTTRGGPGTVTEVFSFKVFNTAFTSYNLGYAAALSIVMLILITIISKFLVSKLPQA